METFDGVTLLATNLEQGLDDAFKRRVRFSIQFELPEEAEREKLWISMFPPQVPLALIAAEPRRPITTADLLDAARQEYREMGRII